MVCGRYKEQEKQLPLVVVKGHGASLFGRNWLRSIRLQWDMIQQVEHSASAEKLLHKFSDLFAPGLGTIKGVTAHLDVNEGAKPICFKPRSVPYALRDGSPVIEKVPHSQWAAPIVPVPKEDGGIWGLQGDCQPLFEDRPVPRTDSRGSFRYTSRWRNLHEVGPIPCVSTSYAG